MMRYLPYLSSAGTREGNPWEFNKPVPEAIKTDKSLRTKWINDPNTDWSCWSCFEGINATARIRKKANARDDQDDNPPSLCYGFIADYDTKLSNEEVAASFDRFAPHLPNYMCRSLSGNVHLLWLFEKPVKVGSYLLAEEFLKTIDEKLGVLKALPCCDSGFLDPAKYYTNGADWSIISDQRIAYATGVGWLLKASANIRYSEMAYNVPLTVVKAELLKNEKFSKLWDGIEFALEAQGPTWWVEGTSSPKSAIVKESGMFTFSDHAPKDFYSWGELIGFSFVDEYRSKHIGQAVENVYFDGRNFWRTLTREDWKAFSKDDILHYLRVVRGLSATKQKDEIASELDMAYEHILDHNNVEGAAPFVFKPNGLITISNKPFLNIHTNRVCRPVDQPVEWGHPDHFPFLSKFFGPPSTVSADPKAPRFFNGGTQALDTFISWLAHYYCSAHRLALASGHNLFIAGPVNVGKTFLNRVIIGGLMNGSREAKEYLMGEDNFGAELFSVAHWVVDDGTMSTSLSAHRRWSEMVKRMAANKTFRYHDKFRTPMQVDWQGRVVSTLNSDEESARLLPDIDRSILDKIEMYLTSSTPTVDFLEADSMKQTIDRELPYFARFLLQWKTPEHCIERRGENIDWRFGGIKPWHDPALIRNANQSSRTAGFVEILTDWKQSYFSLVNKDVPNDKKTRDWSGTAFQLRKSICEASSAAADALRTTDNGDIGRLLSQLKNKGYPITSTEKGDVRIWTITHES